MISRYTLTEQLTDEAHHRYAQWIDRDLIYAEAMIWVHSREILDSDTEAGIVNEGTRHLRGHCERLKAKHLGYEIDDLTWYTTKRLKELVAQHMSGQETTRADEALCDVAWGMRVLDASHRGTIMLYHAGFAHSVSYEEAIRELQAVLGGPKPTGLT